MEGFKITFEIIKMVLFGQFHFSYSLNLYVMEELQNVLDCNQLIIQGSQNLLESNMIATIKIPS